MRLPALDPARPTQSFPAVTTALTSPNGLLAVGGCLSTARLINAYKRGIFPWYEAGEPILWWSPDPRLVLVPKQLKASRSLKKTIRRGQFNITFDRAFSQVIQQCAAPRTTADDGTWLSAAMCDAYTLLHQQGIAHSCEAWFNDELVGGLYGVGIGRVFFGESMFHNKTDASKVAFYHLVLQLLAWDYQLIDCQVQTEHLARFGAHAISRQTFNSWLSRYCPSAPDAQAWKAANNGRANG